MRLYSIVYKIRRIEMQQIILGSAGFLLYFIYDITVLENRTGCYKKFFAAGTILVVLSLFMELWFAWGQCSRRIGRMIGFGIGAMCFLVLLIYTLFFALPFEKTYCEENRLRAAYTEGVYGLCRHPGVLWFAGAYLCMWGMFGGWKQGIYFLLMIFWNYLYIIFRICWTFRRRFLIIENIRKTLPF